MHTTIRPLMSAGIAALVGTAVIVAAPSAPSVGPSLEQRAVQLTHHDLDGAYGEWVQAFVGFFDLNAFLQEFPLVYGLIEQVPVLEDFVQQLSLEALLDRDPVADAFFETMFNLGRNVLVGDFSMDGLHDAIHPILEQFPALHDFVHDLLEPGEAANAAAALGDVSLDGLEV